MPAPKIDFSTTIGRLRYARDKSGIDQEAFAEKIGYDTKDGWAKVEQGQRKLTVDHLIKANSILKLPWAYFFGEMSYEDAITSKSKTYDDLVEKVEQLQKKVIPIEKLDAVTERVRINESLHELVEMIFNEPGNKLKEIQALIFGWLSKGTKDNKERGKHSGTA
jgi:transcriptional regulator with XRE-family HTH domain